MQGTVYNERFGRLALKMRMISEAQFEEACEISRSESKPLDKVLLEQEFITEKEHQELQVALATTGVFEFP